MEAASIALDHDGHGHDHHGPPPANRSSRVEPALLGMLLFIISEIMVFGAFFTAYFFIRVVAEGHTWFPIDGKELPVAVAAVPLGGPLVLGCLFAVFYVANAAAWPLWKQVLHAQVAAGQRATALSASSLALQVGGLTGSLLVLRLADAVGTPAGFWAAAGALLVAALVSLALRPRHSTAADPGTPAAAGVAAGHG